MEHSNDALQSEAAAAEHQSDEYSENTVYFQLSITTK